MMHMGLLSNQTVSSFLTQKLTSSCGLPATSRSWTRRRAVVKCSCTPNESFSSRIKQARVIACVRADSSDVALDLARAALDGGLDVAISNLVEEYPSALIGAGTVLSETDAELAISVGAKFLMSPVTIEVLVQSHRLGPTLYIPGAITPTEVFNAHCQGASLVKLYPVTLMGGVKLVESLRKAMPRIPLVASQGITFDEFDQYLRAGATAVVLSDAIFWKSVVKSREYKRITQQALAVAKKVADCLHEKQP